MIIKLFVVVMAEEEADLAEAEEVDSLTLPCNVKFALNLVILLYNAGMFSIKTFSLLHSMATTHLVLLNNLGIITVMATMFGTDKTSLMRPSPPFQAPPSTFIANTLPSTSTFWFP